jgi:hypothetical protein
MADGARINALSPIFVTTAARRINLPTGATMAAEEAAKAYQAEVGGDMTGQVPDVRECGDERFAVRSGCPWPHAVLLEDLRFKRQLGVGGR